VSANAREGLFIVVVGVVAGLLVAFACGRLIASLMFGIASPIHRASRNA
jgi:hypothetical protein